MGIGKPKYFSVSGAGTSLVSVVPAGKEWILLKARYYSVAGGSTIAWVITTPDGDMTYPVAGATAATTYYEIETAIPSLLNNAAGFKLTPTITLTVTIGTGGYDAGNTLSIMGLEQPLEWDLAYLDWTINGAKNHRPSPPGFNRMLGERLGWRKDVDLL